MSERVTSLALLLVSLLGLAIIVAWPHQEPVVDATTVNRCMDSVYAQAKRYQTWLGGNAIGECVSANAPKRWVFGL